MVHQDVRAFECKHSSLMCIESVHTESHSVTDIPGKSHKYRERSQTTWDGVCDGSQKFQLLGLKFFKNLFRNKGKHIKTPVDACCMYSGTIHSL